MRKRILLVTVLAGALAVVAASASTARESRSHAVTLLAKGLSPLAGSFYELWVIDGGRKFSAGSFNVDRSGRLVGRAGGSARLSSPIAAARADELAVTIEASPDRSRKPSGIVVLAGKVRGGRAALRFPAALAAASGSYFLASPTDSVVTNEMAGIWFLRETAGGPSPSLKLPRLPAGWVYEGWGVTQGKPLSTGRFVSPRGADRTARFSGPKPGPPFPGEDFLRNLPGGVSTPVNLADGSSMVVITLEPDLNGVDPTGAGPFSIKPLVAAVPDEAAEHRSLPLRRELKSVPSGNARL